MANETKTKDDSPKDDDDDERAKSQERFSWSADDIKFDEEITKDEDE